MTISTASGTKVYIGPAVIQTDADTLAELKALAYTEVKEVESIGEFGDESAVVPFSAIGDGRVRKSKGARDAGTLALTVGRDPLDAGQNAVKAAQKTKQVYAIKIVAADAPGAGYSNSAFYFRGLVTSSRDNIGTNDNVVKTTFNIAIDSEIYEEPAAAI